MLSCVNVLSKFSADVERTGARMPNDFLNNFLMLRNIATEDGINMNGMTPAPRFGPAAATTAVPDDRQLCASAPVCLLAMWKNASGDHWSKNMCTLSPKYLVGIRIINHQTTFQTLQAHTSHLKWMEFSGNYVGGSRIQPSDVRHWVTYILRCIGYWHRRFDSR